MKGEGIPGSEHKCVQARSPDECHEGLFISARLWSYFESSDGQSTSSILTKRNLSWAMAYFVANLRGPWIAKTVSGWCLWYGIFLCEKNRVRGSSGDAQPRGRGKQSDSQRVIQHVKQCVNICRCIRNRYHRHAVILFTPPDTNETLHLEHFCENGRVFGEHGFVASE